MLGHGTTSAVPRRPPPELWKPSLLTAFEKRERDGIGHRALNRTKPAARQRRKHHDPVAL